jgi:hypothetical protein
MPVERQKKQKPYKVVIRPSTRKEKKYMAIFYDKYGKKLKTTHFGQKNYEDFTIHKDKDRKQRYINRHKRNENWKDPTTAGALSLYVLWNKPSFRSSVADYKKRFKLK